MSNRTWAFSALSVAALVACTPGPGDVGYVECVAYDLGAGLLACESIDICCEQVERDRVECAYLTQDDRRYPCASEFDCTDAANEVVCDVCDVAGTAGYGPCG